MALLVLVGESSVGPGVRNAHSMVYDEQRNLTLLFGGADAGAVRGDTWAWTGQHWQALNVVGPSPRTFPAMAWDAARSEAVVFGGRRVLFGQKGERATFLSDTLVLRSDGWHSRPVSGPPPRSEAGMTYDRKRQVVVLFGGYNDVGGTITRLGDTWEWDGAVWRQRASTGPAPRSGVALAYDEQLQRVVLFGGSGGPRADTWIWDGARWEPVKTPDTEGRFNSLAAYDSTRQHLVRTTGWNGRERVRETWLFDHVRWRVVSTEGPRARNHSAAAFDRRRGRLVLHGGHDGDNVFGDTWEWDGREWHERASVPPQRRIDNHH
ncbi:MAG: hypothetical protein ACRD26_12615 [Vicinamibacterales bacterium]